MTDGKVGTGMRARVVVPYGLTNPMSHGGMASALQDRHPGAKTGVKTDTSGTPSVAPLP